MGSNQKANKAKNSQLKARRREEQRQAMFEETMQETRIGRALAGILTQGFQVLDGPAHDMLQWGLDSSDEASRSERIAKIFQLDHMAAFGIAIEPAPIDEAHAILVDEGISGARSIRECIEDWVDEWFGEYTSEIVYTDEYMAHIDEKFVDSPLTKVLEEVARQHARP